MVYEDYKAISASIPRQPGVYRYIASDGEIVYVGKAKNLRNRIASYFTGGKGQHHRTKLMLQHASHIEFTIAPSEHDALLLENSLIKKHQPRYNVLLKDGKSYAYICIKKERFPRIFFTRKIIRDGSQYFGPYTSKHRTFAILETIKQIFPLRTCTFNLSEQNIQRGKFKVCLEYHINNCEGACEGHETEETYNEKILQIKNILRGNFKPVKEYLVKEMQFFAERMEFEKAHDAKERLEAIEAYRSKSTVISPMVGNVDVYSIMSEEKYAYVNYLKVVEGVLLTAITLELEKNLDEEEADLLSYVIPILREKYKSESKEIILPMPVEMEDLDLKVTIPQRGDKKHLLDMSIKNTKFFILDKRRKALEKVEPSERILHTMKRDLNMRELPRHIECFDNSNIQGTNPTSSCVVFKNAKPSKKDYRHFMVKTVEGPNDFASMEEAVYRRYKRLLDEDEPLPQLIIIDGGKGQLSSAMKSIDLLGIRDRVTVIGIAKKLEELYFPDDPIPLHINKKSESLKVIQQARDEAHRFALRLHRNRRSNNFIDNELTNITGIGEKTAEKLLKTYKSVKQIKSKTLEELQKHVTLKQAKAIVEHFNTKEK